MIMSDKIMGFLSPWSRFLPATWHLFTAKRFRIHRLWGIVYLAQFIAAVVLEIMGKHEPLLLVTMPTTGVIQSIIACRTFTFLPKGNDKTQGYYHGTKAMSYDFILENIYFAGLLLFQSVYLSFPQMRTNPWFLPLEIIGVFLPYHTVRDFFPKSSFRHSIKEGNKYASFVKFFYVTAKHFSGYYVNYMCFLGLLGSDPINEWGMMRKMFIVGGWGTTIAMFLQTLKFKGYIGHISAMLLYVGCFPFFWIIYAGLFFFAIEHVWLTALTFVGVAVNFMSRPKQIVYQSLLCLLCIAIRFNFITLNQVSTLGGLFGSAQANVEL